MVGVNMAQLNINMTDQFSANLRKYMRLRGIKNKSEAIRIAVKEGIERILYESKPCDFKQWIGYGKKVDLNPTPKFSSDEDLWN
jgi:hypothetical protein